MSAFSWHWNFYKVLAARNLFLFSLLWGLSGCGASLLDGTTPQGKIAMIEKTNQYLNSGDCTNAIATIEDLYQSEDSDNEVRFAMASAYACEANINFFKLVMDLSSDPAALSTGFFALLAKLFPSQDIPSDKTVTAAKLATDALMAMLKPGMPIDTDEYVNFESFNPGSVVAQDRLDDANAFLLFVSMAGIGALENRYVTVDAGHKPPIPTPLDFWNDETKVTATDCTFASMVVNFADTIGSVAEAVNTPSTKASLITLQAVYQQAIFDACDEGCVTICGIASCAQCPKTLRDRTSCTGVAKDPASCAAAGIAKMVNAAWFGGTAVP